MPRRSSALRACGAVWVPAGARLVLPAQRPAGALPGVVRKVAADVHAAGGICQIFQLLEVRRAPPLPLRRLDRHLLVEGVCIVQVRACSPRPAARECIALSSSDAAVRWLTMARGQSSPPLWAPGDSSL